MKKLFAFVLSFLMLFTFTACEKEDVDLALDIAIAVLEELEEYENAESDALPEYVGEGAGSVEEIPEFSGTAYVAVNGNVPFFMPEEITDESYEYYSDLDELGRCGMTMACIGTDIMPTEDRGEIGSVKPTGWQSVKYDCVDGKYLYNRCHLIGFQLAGENANKQNLITGTRYMNVDGMLPFENMIADFGKETKAHVLYRVTPVYEGNDLVAKGVVMEAYSVEDAGESICFYVYVYNVQPGVEIDYATGESWLAEPVVGEGEDIMIYVVNTGSGKFHDGSCPQAVSIKSENKESFETTRSQMLAWNFEPAGCCKP